ncbi:hypothetical protein F511_01960 [Dorcoceras hygrometricum]|uniref:Uncharacterized protein n=1 Tax=Dorcoceras hygrometricum TaxID=472368 RepID=A0A2Z7AVS4_9LAMI|nr:hypothetical protein F511_01960 [Dorcoceras hygrometricum]
MGNCSSSDSASVANTAKLISFDGRLQEFSFPVKVFYVLQKNPGCFICDSDEMNYHDVISAVSDDEELQLGRLYFALPLSNLQRRMRAEEMAALAVKASSALGHKKNTPAVTADVGDSGAVLRRRTRSSARLSTVPE